MVLFTRINADRLCEAVGECLEHGFNDMVVVAAIKLTQVQGHTGTDRDGPEKILRHLSIKAADRVSGKGRFKDQIRPAGKVNR